MPSVRLSSHSHFRSVICFVSRPLPARAGSQGRSIVRSAANLCRRQASSKGSCPCSIIRGSALVAGRSARSEVKKRKSRRTLRIDARARSYAPSWRSSKRSACRAFFSVGSRSSIHQLRFRRFNLKAPKGRLVVKNQDVVHRLQISPSLS